MIELSINGKSIMDLHDSGKTIVKDNEIAKEIEFDINDNSIDFEIDTLD